MNYSIKEAIENVGLPLIISTNEPNLCFLLDTGSTHNILFSFVLDTLSNKFTPLESEIKITGIEGEDTQNYLIKGSIEFNGNKSDVIFAVMDNNKAVLRIQQESGVQMHGILGVPFLMENKWIVDFKSLTISY